MRNYVTGPPSLPPPSVGETRRRRGGRSCGKRKRIPLRRCEGKREKGRGRVARGGGKSSANNVNHTPEGERGGLCARSPPCRVTLEAAKQRERERRRELER